MLLTLDWKKTIDSMAPERLMIALKRFGINTSIRAAIANIYKDRHFHVRDYDHRSGERPQMAGISQGCPLSPFLLGMVMTVAPMSAMPGGGAEFDPRE